MQTKKIMIVDDHPLVRSGLCKLIEGEPGLSVCCEAATMSEALQIVAQQLPDLAIIDLSLPDGNGLSLIRRLQLQHPRILIMVYSMHDDDIFAERALRAGAKGYINKQEAGEQVLVAAKQILNGKVYLNEYIMKRFAPELAVGMHTPTLSPVKNLSNRELEVFELIGHGLATGEIAEKLHLSIKTIETYRSNIKSKLRLGSAGELTRSAVQWTLEAP